MFWIYKIHIARKGADLRTDNKISGNLGAVKNVQIQQWMFAFLTLFNDRIVLVFSG